MRRLVSLLLAIGVVIGVWIVLTPTTSPRAFSGKGPKLVPEEYFLGETKGHGVFFDMFGKLATSFTVELQGTWDGLHTLTLLEKLAFADGSKSERTFNITKTDEHNYVVEMPDLVGPGKIEVYGNCMRWTYTLKQDIGSGNIVQLQFDDWMFLQSDGIILNRAYASKFGLGVGEVFMSVQKLPGSGAAPVSR